MGYNTTVIIRNDGLDQLSKDPELGTKLERAVLRAACGGEQDVRVGNHVNMLTVVETHHADVTTLVAVGGNYASVLGSRRQYSHHELEDQVELLRMLADKLGFRISRKPKKKA